MNIKQFSSITKLSAHTLRYYEKIGLLKQVARNASGHRDFSEQDVVWVDFIKRLKLTGMPLAQISQYAQLREQGDASALLRMEMLAQHALRLQANINEQQSHLDMLTKKISIYREIIADTSIADK